MAVDALLDGIDMEEWVEDGPNRTRTLRLDEAFEITINDGRGKQTVSVESLTFRRPRMRDLKHLKGESIEDMGKFAAGLIIEPAGISQKHLDDLDYEDAMRVIAVAVGFFQVLVGSKTGETPPGG